MREAIRARLLRSAHDCSEGGLAVALAESCIAGGIGADIRIEDDLVPVVSLFSESQSRIVVSVAEENTEALFDLLISREVPYSVLGSVGGETLRVEGLLQADVAEMRRVFEDALAGHVHPEETEVP